MSGGSHNYIYNRIEAELCGQMKDYELNDLMEDIKSLAHDVEWMDSADISEESYFQSVAKFKKKWFATDRNIRLKEYIDKKCGLMKEEMYRLIGEVEK